MKCDDARRALSAAFDGEPAPADLDRHVDTCDRCAAFAATATDVRARLRFEVVDHMPDIATAVLDRLDEPSRSGTCSGAKRAPLQVPKRGLLALVAAALAGVVVGASLVGGLRPGTTPAPVAADVPRRVVAAQTRLDSLTARIEIVEPTRTLTGSLAYRAPESLALVTDGGAVVIDGERAWESAPRALAVTGRAPFDVDFPAPLDLVLPAASFIGDGAVPELGRRDIDGRAAVGVEVSAAQVDPLLTGFQHIGAARAIDPADRVELWLDRASLVPLALDVRHGDEGEPSVSVRLRDVRVNGPISPDAFPPSPAAARVRQGGFEDGAGPLHPERLPAGMHPYRAGTRGSVTVQTWTDGRLWIEVQSTTTWPGGRLFGDVGDVVRGVPIGRSGIAYVGEGGRVVALHGEGIDVAVTGSARPADLVRVAASLGVTGHDVPADWVEAETATTETARAALPRLLVPRQLDGFAPPGIRVDGETVSLAYRGPGAEGFLLVESPGTRLTPPLDADVVGVSVRGRAAHYTRILGALEWVDDGVIVELRSRTLSLAQLVTIARTLRVAS